QTSRHVMRTGAPMAPSAASLPPATAPLQAPVPAETRRPSAAPAARSTPPASLSPAPAARRSAKQSQELRELAAAFARGAGLDAEVAPLTPEWMEHPGTILRGTAEGTLALLQSRAGAHRHMRA